MPDSVLHHFVAAGASESFGPEDPNGSQSVRCLVEPSPNCLPGQGPASCRKRAERLFKLCLQDQALEPAGASSVSDNCQVVTDDSCRVAQSCGGSQERECRSAATGFRNLRIVHARQSNHAGSDENRGLTVRWVVPQRCTSPSDLIVPL